VSEDEIEFPDFSKDPVLKNFWTKTTGCGVCPKCEAKNYVSLGDLEDQTAPDVEAVECWKCGAKSWLSPDTREVAQDMYDSMDGAICDVGKKEP
jgi:Zn ribbon nucleic-acid-binding protein